MVSLVPNARPPAPAAAASKPSKPLLRRATLSGTIRKAEDANLDSDFLSAPPSPSKRVRVTFNPNIEEKVMEEYQVKGRSLESVRLEVKSSIEAHLKGDSEGYDVIKQIFSPRRGDDADEESEADKSIDARAYLLALTSYASLLNKGCSGLVKAILAYEWMDRDESFVKTYVQFLGNLTSAHGAYVGMVLGMLVGHFHGSKTSSVPRLRAVLISL
jgi:RNA polymerase I-specific transcription initiation factor RRN3